MRKFILICFLSLIASSAMSETMVPDVTKVNLAWVDGVYWNPQQLPGWGFFVDAQEETLFGAIYGYEGNDSTFVTLQGTVSRADPLEYRGDVFFVTNGGATVTDVGNFTWSVAEIESSPASRLTITSNILNVTNLTLIRLVYVEDDKIDILTGADWNITTRVLGISFAYSYGIYDDRVVTDGNTGALVINNVDEDEIGAAMYFSDSQENAYGIYIPFLDETDLFAVFLASDTEMFGRYWLLDPGEAPIGNGSYFHGSADTSQASNQELLDSAKARSNPEATSSSEKLREIRNRQRLMYEVSPMEENPMFSDSTVQNTFEKLRNFPLVIKTQRID
ncbi:hypothetical protein ACFL07_01335 [Pseudomonadota bacterium]